MTHSKKALSNNIKTASQEYNGKIYSAIFNKQWQRYEKADKSKKELFASQHQTEKTNKLIISGSKKDNLLSLIQCLRQTIKP